ncbi:glycosyl transferase [Salinimicrobium marinum]|uniref:Glycosyl transferase n=1 Tax=Salinimicrobium marinum TaxID=680283 RepID=A0A918SHF3_9FLAO|nr:glycosyltransferase [Salinimicrobium marinum]GHA43116.1 glycosyl transferase [Salinimicrobium marinum]
MIALAVIITLLYAGLILFLLFGFSKVEEQPEISSQPSIRFSIVVPYRNEAENLPGLFDALINLNYPKDLFEIILVNDASEDTSEEVCEKFRNVHPNLNIKLLNSERLSGSPKKDAINTAIKASEFEYVLTTDADCKVLENWQLQYGAYIEKTGAKMVAGPVAIDAGEKGKTSFLKIFQKIDFLSLQGASIGGFGVDIPFLCNGANLCYEKESFRQVEGFSGNEAIASGDDIFLLEKFQKAGHKTEFLKSREAIVTTTPQSDIKNFISQRIRWAAKTSAYNNSFSKAVGVLVFLMNLLLLVGFIAVVSGVFPQKTFLMFFLIKFNVDFLLIYKTSIFFKREKLMKNYFWCSFLYPVFSSYVGVLSLFKGYSWKGREFKK